jgi:alpha-tubulin suppressor-like RCC1 family protein
VPTLSITAGLFFTCALRPGEPVRCWGDNVQGELGNGSTTDSLAPTAVQGPANTVAVAAGGYNACMFGSDGDAQCWGDNSGGQLGQIGPAQSAVPMRVPDVDSVIQVAVGTAFACALRSAGTGECWGSNNTAQLGNGTLTGAPYFMGAPAPISGLKGAAALTAGGNHACALMTSGSVACWGDNEVGQLGPDVHGMNSDVPVQIPGLSAVVSVSAGGTSSCALTSDGSVWCWGENVYGQLGAGSTKPPSQPSPVKVSGLTGATSVSVGADYACATTAARTAVCWGHNAEGTLGNGTMVDSPVPVPVSQLTGVVGIATGDVHACAQLADRTFSCWGNNEHGQLGDGTMQRALVPVRVVF